MKSPRTQKARVPLGLIAALVVGGVGGAGAAAWYFVLRDKAPTKKSKNVKKDKDPKDKATDPAPKPKIDKLAQTKKQVALVAGAVKGFVGAPDEKLVKPDGCPQSLTALAAGGTHLKKGQDKDAWAKPLVLQCSKTALCVYSIGPNGTDDKGGGDDIKQCPGR